MERKRNYTDEEFERIFSAEKTPENIEERLDSFCTLVLEMNSLPAKEQKDSVTMYAQEKRTLSEKTLEGMREVETSIELDKRIRVTNTISKALNYVTEYSTQYRGDVNFFKLRLLKIQSSLLLYSTEKWINTMIEGDLMKKVAKGVKEMYQRQGDKLKKRIMNEGEPCSELVKIDKEGELSFEWKILSTLLITETLRIQLSNIGYGQGLLPLWEIITENHIENLVSEPILNKIEEDLRIIDEVPQIMEETIRDIEKNSTFLSTEDKEKFDLIFKRHRTKEGKIEIGLGSALSKDLKKKPTKKQYEHYKKLFLRRK